MRCPEWPGVMALLHRGRREERRMAAERLRVPQELREEQEHDPCDDAATDDDIVMTSTSASQPTRKTGVHADTERSLEEVPRRR